MSLFLDPGGKKLLVEIIIFDKKKSRRGTGVLFVLDPITVGFISSKPIHGFMIDHIFG